MIHPLCIKCVQKCKQEDTVKIVHCPKFQKRLSDNEFWQLVDELETMETAASKLKKRTGSLIQKALIVENSDSDEDSEDENNLEQIDN